MCVDAPKVLIQGSFLFPFTPLGVLTSGDVLRVPGHGDDTTRTTSEQRFVKVFIRYRMLKSTSYDFNMPTPMSVESFGATT